MSRYKPYRSARTPYEKRVVVIRLVGGPFHNRRKRVSTLANWWVSEGGEYYSNKYDGTFEWDEEGSRGCRACDDDAKWAEHLVWMKENGY